MLIESTALTSTSYNILLLSLRKQPLWSLLQRNIVRNYLQTGVAAKSSFPVALVLQAVLFTATYGLTPNFSIAAAISAE